MVQIFKKTQQELTNAKNYQKIENPTYANTTQELKKKT